LLNLKLVFRTEIVSLKFKVFQKEEKGRKEGREVEGERREERKRGRREELLF
jgi:hypothetical protein